MRIGINASAVMTGGGATYFANLLPEWGRMLDARGDTLFVYTRRNGRVKVPPFRSIVEVPIIDDPSPLLTRTVRQHALLPLRARQDRLDVFYGPGDSVPFGIPCPTVVAYRNLNIYDPIRLQTPRRRPRIAALRALALASARTCRRAIFVSATARDQIVPVLHLDPKKARVVHHGLGGVFRDALTGPRPWERPYLLTVSTIYHHKNFVRLVQAYDEYVHRKGLPHGLVIVGAAVDVDYGEEIKREIARRGLQEHVKLTGEIRYPGAGPWFKHADAFVFPSIRETFGHPVLEAMAAELPVAASDLPVMREIGGDIPVYFDPISVESQGKALQQVLSGEGRAERVRQGLERVKDFTLEKMAERTLAVMDEAASGS